MWSALWDAFRRARVYAWLGWKIAKVSCRVWARRAWRALGWSAGARVTNARAYASRDWSVARSEWCGDDWETVAVGNADEVESMPYIPDDFNLETLTRLAREGAEWTVLRRALPSGATAVNVRYRVGGATYVACLTEGDALRLGRDVPCGSARDVLRAGLVLEDGTTSDVTCEIRERYGPAGDWHGARETRRLFLPGTPARALELRLRDGRAWTLPMSAPLPDTHEAASSDGDF